MKANSLYDIHRVKVFRNGMEGYKVEAVRYILKDDNYLEKMNYKQKNETFLFKEGIKEIAVDDIEYIESNLHTLLDYFKQSGMLYCAIYLLKYF